MTKDEFAAAVHASEKKLYYAALSVTADTEDAKDAVSDAVSYAWEHIKELRDDSKFDAWLLRVTYSQAKMIRRKNKKHEDACGYEDAFSYEDDTSGIEFFDILSRADLSDAERRILTLRFFYGYTLPEIAKMTCKTEGQTKMKYYRALRKMADMKGLI
ncbi:MAG: sigma-70 family RNA polymerase sigma factor [Clostridia bacterium]|nr:sigma-70 family RNA polymerase sigma factor [Clostridia bacterium]